MVDHGITWRWFYLNPSSTGKELAIRMGLHDSIEHRRRKMVHANVLRMANHCEPSDSTKSAEEIIGFANNQWVDKVRE